MRLAQRLRRSPYRLGLEFGLTRRGQGGYTIVSDGLLAWWKHSEGAGDTVADSIGDNNGTIITSGTDFWDNNGPDGNPVGTYTAANLTYVACGAGVGCPTVITVMAVVYFNSVVEATARCVLCKRGLTTPWAANYKILRLASSGELRFTYSNADATAWHACDTSDFGAAASTWHVMTATFTFGTGEDVQFYKNLTEITSSWTTGDGTDAPGATNKATRLGYDAKGGQYNDGRLGDTLIYDRVLSYAEIEQNYAVLQGRYNL